MSSNASIPVPGWYPDPEYPGYVRYWDGAAWVADSSRPSGEFEQPSATPGDPRGHAGGTADAGGGDPSFQAQGRVIQGEVIAAQSVPIDPNAPAPGFPGQPAAEPAWDPRVSAAAAAASGAPAAAKPADAFIPPPRNDLFATASRSPAPLVRRLLARIADLLVPIAVGVGVAIVMVPPAIDHLRDRVHRIRYEGRTETVWLLDGRTALAGGAVVGSVLLAMLVYEALPTWRWGRSLGKTLFGLRVVDIDSHDLPGFRQSLMRWLVFSVPGLLVVGVIGMVRAAFDKPWRQGWHDKAARTFVAGDG
ncbi:RDD family protein [Yinghuangia seranimata]|uniref:RDD family protein n=1 Tax=Yinghuangia seranimata TaxID=408067 RepID=UPI00248B1E10|nr:RDD family protein [Yinghuangia seranimata]MDI2131388.1 RDD family protein [Yinghuangia seranimata]